MDRRKFIKMIGAGAALTAIPWKLNLRHGLQGARAQAFAQSLFANGVGLTKFVDPLPGLGPTGIPVMASDRTHIWPLGRATHYSIDIGQYKQVLHSDFVNPSKPAYMGSTSWPGTTLWGYGQKGNFKHLGGVIVAQKGKPVQITFTNKLVDNYRKALRNPLPVDVSSFFPDAAPSNRTAVHLHGGLVPWISDGGPYDWWDPFGNHGPSFLNNLVLNPFNRPGQAEYYYPNNQSSRLVWYHDHAHDLTRLNAYAGVASGYLIVDPATENPLITKGILPTLPAPYQYGIPLITQDKIFVPQNINTIDPTWQNVVPDPSPGNLWYAHVYDETRWTADNTKPKYPPPDPSCIPEFFGDTMLMNGHVFPFLEVPPQRVRFRFLNAFQARFINMVLLMDDGSADSITMDADSFGNGIPAASVKPGPPMVMIGTEGGFLPAPVVIQNPDSTSAYYKPITLCPFIALETVNPDGPFNLCLGPAERADLIIDFNGLPAGTKVIMYSDAPAPFPGGDPVNTYYPGNPNNPVSPQPGYGPNSRQIMQFRVAGTGGDSMKFDDWYKALTNVWPTVFASAQPPLFIKGPTVSNGAINLPSGVPIRSLTLNETFDDWGRLIQLLGTNVQKYPPTFGQFLADTPTEVVSRGDTEVWQIANLTGDVHPIHFHLVNVQVLARQPFDSANYNGTPNYLGQPPFEPEAYEKGWKETVRMNPDEVITVVMKFDLPRVPFLVPFSPRMKAMGIPNANEYVWHCHILEHEEHDMMRPLVVKGLNPIGF